MTRVLRADRSPGSAGRGRGNDLFATERVEQAPGDAGVEVPHAPARARADADLQVGEPGAALQHGLARRRAPGAAPPARAP